MSYVEITFDGFDLGYTVSFVGYRPRDNVFVLTSDEGRTLALDFLYSELCATEILHD